MDIKICSRKNIRTTSNFLDLNQSARVDITTGLIYNNPFSLFLKLSNLYIGKKKNLLLYEASENRESVQLKRKGQL